ncbi:MAG: Na/Pi symporter [Thermonemataceae bacterium]
MKETLTDKTPSTRPVYRLPALIPRIILFFLVSLAFLIALELMVNTLKLFGEEEVRDILSMRVNPFVALFAGLLTTSIVQSSSLVTSIIVAMVAAGNMDLQNATYMVIGANIGTTITCMIVSLGHVTRKKEFRKAFAGSMIHVLFNVLAAIIVFPLEYYWGLLSRTALYFTSFIQTSKHLLPIDFVGIIKSFTTPAANFLIDVLGNYVLSLALSLLLLVICLRLFSSLFKQVAINNFLKKIETFLFGNAHKALGWGIFITAILHSSSIVTSFIVAMVASNRISLRRSLPFIMGANIGTTITALTASIGTTEFALAIALVHLIINVLITLLIYPFSYIKDGIVNICRQLGKMSVKYRTLGFASILFIFFIIPFLLIYVSEKKGEKVEKEVPVQQDQK